MLRIGLLFATGCGYSVAAVHFANGDAYRVAVAPIVDRPAVDVDAAGFVATSVRSAVMREHGLTLTAGEADGLFTVEILSIDLGLGAFAEPNLRAARYQVTVVLRCRLAEGGREVWTSPPITGAAPFFSPPGRIEALDGAGRRALERASREAADRAVAALMVTLLRSERSRSAAGGP